jgi:hypothetical protein
MKKLLMLVMTAALAACAPLAPLPQQPAKNYTGGNYDVYPLCCTPDKGNDGL